MNNPQSPFIVELFGLPGSGKTTLVRELLPLMQDREIPVLEGAKITKDNLPKAGRFQAKLSLLFRELPGISPLLPTCLRLMAQRQNTVRDQFKTAYVCATVGAVNARLNRLKANAILDQGAAQAAWTTLLEAKTARPTTVLHGRMRALACHHRWHVVVLDAPVEIIRHRLLERASKHSRLQSAARLHDPSVWQRASSSFRQISAELETGAARGELVLKRLPTGEARPEELAQTLMKMLTRCQGPEPGPEG